MKGITFLATAVGLLVSFATVFLLEWVGLQFFPIPKHPKPSSIEEWEAIMATFPIGAFWLVALGHGLGVLFGGLAVNRIDKNSIIGYLIVFLLMFVTTATNALAYPHPTWFKVVDICAVLFGGFIAWRFLKWK
jgi:hypothetical protein